jgi:nucleotidyltransferase/DNA polymerase involved in DNA repair
MASDSAKPDGLTIVRPQQAEEFLSHMDVEKIPGIGTKTATRLTELGVKTVADLARLDQFSLAEEFGKRNGAFLYNASRGINHERVQDSNDRKQIARITTLKKDSTSSAEMEDDLFILCKSVASNAANMGVSFGNIAVFIIRTDLDQISKSKTLKNPADSFEVLHPVARGLLGEVMGTDGGQTARRLGVRVSDLHDSRGQNTMLEFLS